MSTDRKPVKLVTPDNYRYAIYGVSEEETPLLLAGFEDGDIKGATDYAQNACNNCVTCYIFDMTRGLKGRSRALVYACAPHWVLDSDENNYWIETSDEASHINWHGQRVTEKKNAKDLDNWPSEDMAVVDFLNTDGAGIADVSSLEKEIREVFSKYGVRVYDVSPKLSHTAYSELREREYALNKKFRETYYLILKAMPDDFLINGYGWVKNPNEHFNAALYKGDYDHLSQREFDLLSSAVNLVSSIWRFRDTIQIGELVWKAIAYEAAGIDVRVAIAAALGKEEAIQAICSGTEEEYLVDPRNIAPTEMLEKLQGNF